MNQNQYAENPNQFGQNTNQFNQPPMPHRADVSANTVAPKHSKMGIASLVLGVLSIALAVVTFTLVYLLRMRGALVDGAVIIVLLLVVLGGLTGAVFGLATLFTKNTKKAFGVVGLALNLFFLGCLILDVIYENINKF